MQIFAGYIYSILPVGQYDEEEVFRCGRDFLSGGLDLAYEGVYYFDKSAWTSLEWIANH